MWIEPRMFWRRCASSLLIFATSRANGSKRRRRPRKLLAVTAEALRAALEQQLQVRLGVAVERRQDFVRLHVRLRLWSGMVEPLLDQLAPGPGVHLEA